MTVTIDNGRFGVLLLDSGRSMNYRWDLAGPDGAAFVLAKQADHHTRDDIKEAKHHLRATQDVVFIRVVCQEEFDECYR